MQTRDILGVGAAVLAAVMALTATCKLPSVPFLNPTGMESPLAISRWVWLSVVLAPMAVQLMRSAMYCGLMGSSNSVPQGMPD